MSEPRPLTFHAERKAGLIFISPTPGHFFSTGPCRLAVFLVMALTTIHVYGQTAADQQSENDIDVLNRAELDIQRLVSRQFFREDGVAISINRKLNDILQRDPASPLRSRIETDLVPVQEYLAKKDLDIANLYLNREHGGLRGAESRLRRIVKDFPHFSRMDEVLFGLSTVSLRDENVADARKYLRELICRFPASVQARSAFERLGEIGFGDWEGCDKFRSN